MAYTAININPEGIIIQQAGIIVPISITKTDVGHYELEGTLGLANQGWKTSIYKDENGNNTINVEFEMLDNKLIIKTYDTITNEPKDIENALTLRLEVEEVIAQ